MIFGTVTFSLEAMVRIHVEDGNGQTQAVDVKIDTGFTGFLSLPTSLVTAFGLMATTQQYVQVADGTVVSVPVHSAVVIWDGKPRRVDVHSMGTERILGMAMLAGHDLTMRVRDGGHVSISLVT
ncbi:MAG: clan AA aspartic protease [Planctomycetes bacterium]|jgi:clan AA aspartic protease|nr:clan AA aspartic protease [Planctomycetota bacterium]